MKKIIIIVSLVVLGIIGLMWWGKSVQKTAVAGNNAISSSLTASENVYDFGTISMKNGLVTKDFTVTNPGSSDVYVPSLTTSCMCTKAFIVGADGSTKGPFGMPSMGYVPPANETLKSGESRIIRVVYDPNAHGPAGIGKINRFITLQDSSGGKLQLEIRALVTP